MDLNDCGRWTKAHDHFMRAQMRYFLRALDLAPAILTLEEALKNITFNPEHLKP